MSRVGTRRATLYKPPVAASGANGLLNALIAYWPLNEAGGANDALDAHTNSLTLTQVSNPGANTGKIYSTARTFDGTADYFTRNDESLLRFGNADWSVAAWVYLSSKTGDLKPIVSKDNTSIERELNLQYSVSFDRFRCNVFDGTTMQRASVNADTLGSPSLNTWYLVVAWHNATTGEIGISVDNTTPTTASTSGAPGSSIASFRIGTIPAIYFFSGRIGPVAMWKSAAGGGGVLTAAQRTALYNSGNGLAYSAFTA